MITRLRELGVNISIDDYGTGLSTLDYLKKIPASEIKIDQSFVKGIARQPQRPADGPVDHRSRPLARPQGRRRRRRASGQFSMLLVEMNCDIAQGFAIGRPMSLESLTQAPDLRPQARRGLTTQAKLGSCTEAVHFFARPLWLPVY